MKITFDDYCNVVNDNAGCIENNNIKNCIECQKLRLENLLKAYEENIKVFYDAHTRMR